MSHLISTKIFTKISELDEAVGFNTADEFVVVNDAVTQKITGYNLTESIVSMGNLATKAYVDAVVDGAPALLDTLNELAAALNDDANFATNIITSINSKLSTDNFGLEFWNALTGVTTFHIPEDTNLYYTQARFDAALAAKTTTNLAEGSNLYFTEQRVLDIIALQPTNNLISGSFEVTLNNDGTLSLPADPTSDNHAATKGYVDNQVDYVVAGQGFATLGYVEDAIGAVISTARTAITDEISTAISSAGLDGGQITFDGTSLGYSNGGTGGSSGSGAISVVKVEKVNDEYVFTTLSGDVTGEYNAELNTAFFTLNGFTSLPSNVFAIEYYEVNGTMYNSMYDLFNSGYGIDLVGSDDINPLTNFDPSIHRLRQYQFSQRGTTFYSFHSNGGSSGGVTSYNDLTDKPTLFQIGIKEPISAQISAAGVVDHDMATANIFNHSNLAGDFTCNVINLSLPTNNAINVTLIINQGTTPYMPTAFQIGGVAQTINWLNGIAPAGTASKIDVASFSILNNSGTYTVLGSLSTFG